jgi:hypothetical protein
MQRHAKVLSKTSAGQEWAGTLSWCERHKCIQTSRSNWKFPSPQNFPKFSMSMALNLNRCQKFVCYLAPTPTLSKLHVSFQLKIGI